MPAKKTIYCSLDIEGTGLDPEKDQITEVGAVLFEINSSGETVLLKEFSELVRPTIPIPPFIQDLTKITDAMVADADPWEQVRPRFADFIGEAPIVGQNIQFDLNFLAAYGLALPQSSIDTKIIAEVLVPEAKYYNLEYLLRFFGDEISNHHRALEDAKSAVQLLQHLVRRFRGLPFEVQKNIGSILRASRLSYRDMFRPQTKRALIAVSAVSSGEAVQPSLFDQSPSVEFSENFSRLAESPGVNFFHAGESLDPAAVCASLNPRAGERTLISVADTETLLRAIPSAARRGWPVLHPPEQSICQPSLQELLACQRRSDTLAQFLIKLLVWRAVAPDPDRIESLRLYGEEYFFRESVTADPRHCAGHRCIFSETQAEWSQRPVALTTHRTWLLLSGGSTPAIERVICFDTSALEEALNQQSLEQWSFKSIRANLSLLYDHARQTGIVAPLPKNTHDLFARLDGKVDLFFGLVGMLASSEYVAARDRAVDNDLRATEEFSRAAASAASLASDLREALAALAPQTDGGVASRLCARLESFASFCERFFCSPPQSGSLAWIECFSDTVKLKMRASPSQSPLARVKNLSLVGLSHTDLIRSYYRQRFGLGDYDSAVLDVFRPTLVVGLPEPEGRGRETVDVFEEIKSHLAGRQGRAIVLFNAEKGLEQWYEKFSITDLKPHLVVQKYTGHQWKNAERFSADAQAVWLMSTNHFLKSPRPAVPVEILILCRIPFDQPGVLAALYDPDEVFEAYVVPKTAVKCSRVVDRFLSSGAERSLRRRLIVLDPRIALDYAEEFRQAILELCDPEII